MYIYVCIYIYIHIYTYTCIFIATRRGAASGLCAQWAGAGRLGHSVQVRDDLLYTHVCMYIYIYIYTHVYMYVCISLSLSIYIYIYRYIHTHVHVCICIYIYIIIYIYKDINIMSYHIEPLAHFRPEANPSVFFS